MNQRMLSRTRPGFTLIETLVLLALIVIISSLLSPAIHQAQQDRMQMQCRNNLKQIALAMHNYHDTHSTFPPGWVSAHWAANSGPAYGWQVFILPYMDLPSLYEDLNPEEKADLSKRELKQRLTSYQCPLDPMEKANAFRDGLSASHYSANFGDLPAPRLGFGRTSLLFAGNAETPREINGIFGCNTSTRMRMITDGTSNTMLISERSSKSRAGIWMGVGDNSYESDAVTDASFLNPPNQSINGFSSFHAGGINVGFCDGSVRMLSEKVSTAQTPTERGTWQLIANRQDGEPVNDDF